VYSTIREPEWLWSQFGEDVARRGASLVLSGTQVSDSQIAQLARLHDLGGLYLDETAVTNDGLVCLAGMHNLVALSLRRTDVTELPSMSHMRELVDLDLSFTKISTIDLTGLHALQNLNLRATGLDDDALQHFPPLQELRSLDIARAPGQPMSITDRSIKTITRKKFPKLKAIFLYHCDVSEAELTRIKSEFPGIRLHR